jgi:hypothetical protein
MKFICFVAGTWNQHQMLLMAVGLQEELAMSVG